jgi:hypothetical protein
MLFLLVLALFAKAKNNLKIDVTFFELIIIA